MPSALEMALRLRASGTTEPTVQPIDPEPPPPPKKKKMTVRKADRIMADTLDLFM